MSNKGFLAITVCVAIALAGCTGNEIGYSKEVSPDAVYFDYNVWGDEESGNVTAKLQYRFGGPNGTTLVLEGSAKVEFDGELLAVDSSRMNGAWYEVNKPVKDFEGRHIITYTGINNKQYQEEFYFKAFSLRKEVPKEIKRDDLVFELDGLQQEDYIRILLTDTSFYSRGIDRLDTVRNGKIMITRKDLDNLKNGPVSLEFYREYEKALKQGTKEGGVLSVSYGLKRVFELED
ncbi:MAG: hypothetical protein ABI675_03375 [Chitinophagaceae bacterium]